MGFFDLPNDLPEAMFLAFVPQRVDKSQWFGGAVKMEVFQIFMVFSIVGDAKFFGQPDSIIRDCASLDQSWSKQADETRPHVQLYPQMGVAMSSPNIGSFTTKRFW